MTAQEELFERDGRVKPEALQENAWLQYLTGIENPYWNAERISRMDEKKENAALQYVLRTLDILDTHEELDQAQYELLRTVLCWSEVAKGGTTEDRERWMQRGYPLEIHNEASALIYADHVHVRDREKDPAFLLIQTHGLAGQYIRGECALRDSAPLRVLARTLSKTEFCLLIETLNECIIRAVSENIWNDVKEEIHTFAERIFQGDLAEKSAKERLDHLLPGVLDTADPSRIEKAERLFAEKVFPHYDLWYFESALKPFGLSGATAITSMAAGAAGSDIEHLNFKPLADALYYDYQNKKHVNTYRQRIIERWLEEPAEYEQHVRAQIVQRENVLLFGIVFTPVCEKLIDFCVEAERSGLLSYEKSITMLYDTFGFRRDSFDRLNNEESYLSTMNDADQSTKLSILDYVVGTSVLDVGSGGGVLLDALETRFPDKTVTGTDISQNVIDVLKRKKAEEGKKWNAVVHNFVEGPYAEPVDNIIFSSILHEIYSYTDLGEGKFDPRSLQIALKNAFASLNPGGRIIIRDGVKTEGPGKLLIHFKTEEGMDFFKQFVHDFHGMDSLSEAEKVERIDPERKEVLTDINFGREFLYTYTWGRESFAHESQECFGYYTPEEYRRVMEGLGMQIVTLRAFLEPGYEEHLSPLVDITDENGEPVPFPNSNIIIVAEK